MVQVEWTQRARALLKEAVDYISGASPQNAQRYAERVVDATKQLTAFPMSGRVAPEFDDTSIRELIVGNYRVLYRYSPLEELVTIVGVFHGKRILPSRIDLD